MRTRSLAHLASHVAVEIGDVIQTPEGSDGRITSLDPRSNTIKLAMPLDEPTGHLVTSPDAVGLVWMDQAYLKPRPVGEVDHRPASGC